MPKSGKTVVVARSEGRVYMSKALEFLEAARAAAEASRSDATMMDAIHAAISAADAVAAALAGRRSTDPDHQRAVDLLEEVAGASSEIKQRARQLQTLVAKKNAVEYESRRATAKEASDTLRRAERFVSWAKETVDRARV